MAVDNSYLTRTGRGITFIVDTTYDVEFQGVRFI